MSTKKLQVHSENILPIIKRWLYSEKDIFIRELVSNSVDAIRKTKILRDRSELDVSDEEFRIDLSIDAEKKTLCVADTGIGMTSAEVEEYIAQVAFSSAEKFVEQYQSENETDQIIGHFGLGFYSAFMAAERVDLNTRSYKANSEPVLWSCDGSTEYELGAGDRETRGTEITMHMSADGEEYLDAARLREILLRYCAFVPYPVYLNGERINTQEPLWKRSPADCTDEDYRAFYSYLYPTDPEPLFWIHLNIDYPFHLQGILYFPKTQQNVDPQRRQIQLYCNRIFVTEGCEEVIPEYLLGLQGVIDSPDIPLNVSRSYLQMDRTVRQLSKHISKKVADRLSGLFKADRERYIGYWPDIQTIVKVGALQDEKFYERTKGNLLWHNTEDAWTTVEEYLERNREKTNGRVFYTTNRGAQESFLKIYSDKGIEVLRSDMMVDNFLINFLESKLEDTSFQRIDGAVDDSLLDKEREDTVLDAEGRTGAARLAQLLKGKLSKYNVEVEAKSLASDDLPGFVMVQEQHRRMREYMMATDPKRNLDELGFEVPMTFVVNTNHRLMSDIEKLDKQNPDLAESLAEHTYQLALLSQGEMSPKQLNSFVSASGTLMEKMANELTKSA